MERVVRNGIVRYLVRRRGLSALVLVLALPWTAAGALSGLPAFYVVAGVFLLAALLLMVPARAFAVDAAAGTLRIALRSLDGRVERRTVSLGEIRGVRTLTDRSPGRAEAVEIWIDLPGGRSLLAVRGKRGEALRRGAERLAADLGCPHDAAGLQP